MDKLLSILLNILTLGLYYVLVYDPHIYQVKTFASKYGYVSYEQFKCKFEQTDWELLGWERNSLKSKGKMYSYTSTQTHADYFSFNGVGYMMESSWALFKAKCLIERKAKELRKTYNQISPHL